MHPRQSRRPAARQALRRLDGRFAALPAPDGTSRQIDYGSIPVSASHSCASESTPLDLPQDNGYNVENTKTRTEKSPNNCSNYIGERPKEVNPAKRAAGAPAWMANPLTDTEMS